MPLTINVPGGMVHLERENKIKDVKGRTIELEHSLISISKWESKWQVPFLSLKEKTGDAMRDYIRCMTITPNVDPNLYYCLTNEHYQIIQAYIDNPCSATRFRGEQNNSNTIPRSQTSERIYAKMASLGISWTCEKWHINRLLTLIHECELMESGSKMSKKDSLKYASQLNAMRRAKYHSRG